MFFKVLHVDVEKKKLALTLKKSLVNTKLPILSTYSDAKTDMVVEGFISKIQENGVLVNFFNRIKVCSFHGNYLPQQPNFFTQFPYGRPIS